MGISKEIASYGARLIQFSPDSRWFLLIGADNRVRLFRITTTNGQAELAAKAVVLNRISRHPSPIKTQHGSHDGYEGSISRVAFSADSRILAVSDLSGFIDTWVLEGYEDLTQEPNGILNGHKSASSSEDSDSDSDLDSDSEASIILGQHWIRNPQAELLPKLPSTPLILSFRPSKPGEDGVTIQTPILPHPTRHNAHPISHDLPKGEDRLIAVTAQNSVYEYSVLSGGLSDWSRRNPPERFPAEYRQLRDRAKGAVWDIRRRKERLWVYGFSFLFMFDLYMDFPVTPEDQGASASNGAAVTPTNGTSDVSKKSKKRKREVSESVKVTRDLGKPDSGAGSKAREEDIDTGIGSKIRKVDGSEIDDAKPVDASSKVPESDSDSEDEEGEDAQGESQALIQLRRGEEGPQKDRKAFWHTLKYRPIFGIVPISPLPTASLPSPTENADLLKDIDTTGLSKNQIDRIMKRAKKSKLEAEERRAGVGVGSKALRKKQPPLEVVLVERPLWDMDLPSRLEGTQEWDK